MESTKSRQYCSRLINEADTQHPATLFCGASVTCDCCSCPVEMCEFFADCLVPGSEQWGYMCENCIATEGMVFSWGKGQLYQQIPDVGWLLVAGQAPANERDL